MSKHAPPEPLRRANVREASAALAAAFFEDPLTRFLLPDDGSRTRWLRFLHESHLRSILPEGHVYRVGDGEIAGVIGVLPPDRYPMPSARTLGYLARLIWRLPSGGFPLGRVLRGLQAMRLIEKLHVQEPHWYVSVLGVQPERQGTGLGGALLSPVLSWTDRDRLPAYLETAKETNLSFYGHFGFEVIHQVDTPGGGPPIWTMLRQPVG